MVSLAGIRHCLASSAFDERRQVILLHRRTAPATFNPQVARFLLVGAAEDVQRKWCTRGEEEEQRTEHASGSRCEITARSSVMGWRFVLRVNVPGFAAEIVPRLHKEKIIRRVTAVR